MDDSPRRLGTAYSPLREDAEPGDAFKPLHKQEVYDKQGRRRFHGAFTGGFSAGYFNTVGSKEGFQPRGFSSSRGKRAEQVQQRREDFMDEEDDPMMGRVLRTREEFAKDDPKAVIRRTAALESAARGAAIPGPVPSELVVPVRSVGELLLARMGWREGQGVGPRMRRQRRRIRVSRWREGDKADGGAGASGRRVLGPRLPAPPRGGSKAGGKGREDETPGREQGGEDAGDGDGDGEDEDDPYGIAYEFAPRNAPVFEVVPKTDAYGLGFDPVANAPEFAAYRIDREARSWAAGERRLALGATAAVPAGGTPHERRLMLANVLKRGTGTSTAFGLGALELEDEEDLVYRDAGEEAYDRELGEDALAGAPDRVRRALALKAGGEEDHASVPLALPGLGEPLKALPDPAAPRCFDGRLALPGFRLAARTRPTPLHRRFPRPRVPREFVERHVFTERDLAPGSTRLRAGAGGGAGSGGGTALGRGRGRSLMTAEHRGAALGEKPLPRTATGLGATGGGVGGVGGAGAGAGARTPLLQVASAGSAGTVLSSVADAAKAALSSRFSRGAAHVMETSEEEQQEGLFQPSPSAPLSAAALGGGGATSGGAAGPSKFRVGGTLLVDEDDAAATPVGLYVPPKASAEASARAASVAAPAAVEDKKAVVTVLKWRPARLLCKRFNVRDPYDGSSMLPGTQQEEEQSETAGAAMVVAAVGAAPPPSVLAGVVGGAATAAAVGGGGGGGGRPGGGSRWAPALPRAGAGAAAVAAAEAEFVPQRVERPPDALFQSIFGDDESDDEDGARGQGGVVDGGDAQATESGAAGGGLAAGRAVSKATSAPAMAPGGPASSSVPPEIAELRGMEATVDAMALLEEEAPIGQLDNAVQTSEVGARGRQPSPSRPPRRSRWGAPSAPAPAAIAGAGGAVGSRRDGVGDTSPCRRSRERSRNRSREPVARSRSRSRRRSRPQLRSRSRSRERSRAQQESVPVPVPVPVPARSREGTWGEQLERRRQDSGGPLWSTPAPPMATDGAPLGAGGEDAGGGSSGGGSESSSSDGEAESRGKGHKKHRSKGHKKHKRKHKGEHKRKHRHKESRHKSSRAHER